MLRVAKVVNKACADYKRILHEADIIKNLKYSGIPIIFDIEEDKDSICIIEEYISGKSLSDLIESGEISAITDIIEIAFKVCCVLEYLHNYAGIVHLDIKPANIIIREGNSAYNTDKFDICVIDFDSSGLIEDNNPESLCGGQVSEQIAATSRAGYGTPGFAAPEQYSGEGSVESDIYSVGILLLYMVSSGHIQSVAADADKLCKLHSKSVGSVIKKCIRHNPSQRYKSITSLKNALYKVLKKSYKNKSLMCFIALKLCQNMKLYRVYRAFCEKDNKNNNINKVHNIFVAGTKRGVGVTHFCFCLSSFLAKKGKSVVCIRHGDSQDYRAEKISRKKNTDGTYSCGRINILPDYNDGIVCDLSEYEYHIHDMGSAYAYKEFQGMSEAGDMYSVREVSGVSDISGFEGDTRYILVGDYGYRRQDMIVMAKSDKETIIFLNHVSGKAFYECVKKLGKERRCYRFPCMYEWDEKNELFEEAVNEIFETEKQQ